MIDHCISSLRAYMEERRYRAYITDSLRLIGETLAKRLGGSYINARWADGLDLKQDTRTGDEIAVDVIRRAGLNLGGENGI